MVVSPQPSSERQAPSERVVDVVAEEADTDPLELPPLYNTIDTDALDALVETMSSGSVQFHYAGHSVTVYGDGSVDLSEASSVDSNAPESAADD